MHQTASDRLNTSLPHHPGLWHLVIWVAIVTLLVIVSLGGWPLPAF